MKKYTIFLIVLSLVILSGCSGDVAGDPVEQETIAVTVPELYNILMISDSVPLFGPVSKLHIDGQDFPCGITSSFYRMPAQGHLRSGDGLFLVCADDVEMNQGSHYDALYVDSDSYQMLPRSFFLRDYSVRDQSLTIAFEYAEFGKQFVITYISEDMHHLRIYPNKIDDGYLTLLLELNLEGRYISYPVHLNPRTGEFIDFLSSVPGDQFPDGSINSFAFTENGGLLVRLNGGGFYYYDGRSGSICNVAKLVDFEPEYCSALRDALVCYAADKGFVRFDLATQTVSAIPLEIGKIEFFYGLNTTGNQTYVLYRNTEDKLLYFDFLSMTGDFLPEPDTWRIEGEMLYPSYDGRKVYQFCRNARQCIEALIFDCDLSQMILLERENMNAVTETRIDWARDGSLVIEAEEQHQYYVYQWKDQEPDMIHTEVRNIFQPQDRDFVRVRDYIPDLAVEMKYAFPDNFTGHAIYEFEEAWLRYGTVKKLMAVQDALRPMGLGLKLWDGFRPVAAQFKLWEILPDDTYVADPNRGFSSHSRGNTVDITLVDAFGAEVSMPTGFDDFSALADRNYSDCPAELAANAILLENIMQENGFVGYYGEWWHFADSVRYDVETCFDPGIISTWYADCREFISLRREPDTAAPVLDRIPVRETCTLLGYHEEFAYVDFRGQRGYVLSSYLKKK